jgi:hypothetical protein
LRAAEKAKQKGLQPPSFPKTESSLLSKAQQQLDEDEDEVKAMNQLVLAGKVLTVRDRQVEENKLLESDWLEEQNRLDLMMEIERLKSLQEQEARNIRRALALQEGKKQLVDQIKSREVLRQQEQELLEKEKIQMLKNVQEVEEQDRRI